MFGLVFLVRATERLVNMMMMKILEVMRRVMMTPKDDDYGPLCKHEVELMVKYLLSIKSMENT